MFVYKISWLVYFLSICTGNSEDVVPNLYCNTETLTWREAWNKCKNAQGTPVAYVTGTGLNIKDIHLHREADVWTSDYALLSPTFSAHRREQLCGFNYLPNNILRPNILYCDCNAQRYYLCKNDTTKGLDVHESKRFQVKCQEPISTDDLIHLAEYITPGYYWTEGIKNVTIEVLKGTQLPSTSIFRCGAYSADKGQYFADCNSYKSSLCYFSKYSSQTETKLDKRCFENDNVESTMRPVSSTIQKTARYTHFTAQPSASRTSLSLTSLSSSSEDIRTSTTKQSLPVNRTTVTTGRKGKKSKETDSNLGVSVGVPVGLGIVMICGIILGLYILRRHKCSKSRSKPHGSKENVSQKNLPSSKPENASYNIGYGISFFKGKKTSDKQKKTGDKPLQNSVPEYAVVRKKHPKTLTQGQNEKPSLKERTNEPVQGSVCEGNSFCYARADHKTGVDLFVSSSASQTSEYSFATEMAGDFVNNDGEQSNVGDDDYDVTCNVKHFNLPNNTYSSLQTECYDTFHKLRRVENTYNTTNVPNDQEPQTDYNTAYQRDHNVGTDNIYNRLC